MGDQMTETPTTPSRREFWIGVLVTGALFALLVGGVVLSSSGYATAAGRFLPFGPGHRHDPEIMQERVDFVAGLLLHRVGANDAQQDQVQAILDRTVSDMLRLREELGHHELHQAAVAELTAEKIDRVALEELRIRKLAAIDAMSKRMVEALADIGEVLTPEQRLELSALAERFHGH
jgi:Spy/CpxP family protein refolding chaperone